ncbi:MAG: UbiA prenyltransferase family protein [Nitrosotalea sp.]
MLVQRNNTVSAKIHPIYSLIKSRAQRGLVFTGTTMTALLVSSLQPSPLHVILLPIITMFSTLSIYLMNDLVDIKIDKINSPARPLASGAVKKRDALNLVIGLGIGSVAIASLISILTVYLTIAYLLIGVLYSIPKISLKDRSFAKTIMIAIGGLTTALIGSSSAGLFEERSTIAAITFMVLIFVTSPINDLADYAGDKKYGKKTIPIVIGKKNTVLVAIMLPFAIAVFFWFFHTQINFGILTPLSITILSFFALGILKSIYNNRDDQKHVRQKHKKLVFLHYGLQIAFLVGMVF